jgi:hypothetical protein
MRITNMVLVLTFKHAGAIASVRSWPLCAPEREPT